MAHDDHKHRPDDISSGHLASELPPSQRRLVAVSNRTAAGETSRAGGLAVALWDALVTSGGLWVGWSGRIADFPSRRVERSVEDGVEFCLTDMSKADYEGFYLGYSNSVLWPVLHNRITLAHFDSEDFDSYRAINQRLANVVTEVASEDDVVWVHDYHFMLMARDLRALGWAGECGYFLHIPFPAPEIFRAIPDHLELGDGLTSFDVIGVQTSNDLHNLSRYLQEDHGAVTEDGELHMVNGRTILLRHCPIGIDVETFQREADSPAAVAAAKRLARFLDHRELVIGVDRMDYSKGLPQRFEGMATLFDKNPDLHGKISYTQIAPPSRSLVDEYIALREKLDSLSGRINGDYGDLDWIPIRYLARGYSRQEIAGLYRLARVGLVTPLQDGMNLVAKEFIAAQDPEDPGVLVLSEFAGAAEQMAEALVINPHNVNAIADAVKQALDMPLDERKRRWKILYDGIAAEDISWWQKRFLDGFDILAAARSSRFSKA